MDKARDLRRVVLELALQSLPESAWRAHPDVIGLVTAYRLPEPFLDLLVEVLEDSERSVGTVVALVQLAEGLVARLAREWDMEPEELWRRFALENVNQGPKGPER